MWRRVLLMAVALALGFSGAFRASAQIAESGVPAGATDGASIAYLDASGEDEFAPVYSLSVFTFDDEAAAADVMERVPRDYSDLLAAGLDPENPMGDAELVPVDSADLAGIGNLGDDARAYRVRLGDDTGGLSLSLLTIRDGANVHLWLSFVLDFGALPGDQGTPAATPAATPATADANEGLADLVGIGDAWFNGDKPDGGNLIDQLPAVDHLPDGYTEVDRYENLDDFENAVGPSSGVNRAA